MKLRSLTLLADIAILAAALPIFGSERYPTTSEVYQIIRQFNAVGCTTFRS